MQLRVDLLHVGRNRVDAKTEFGCGHLIGETAHQQGENIMFTRRELLQVLLVLEGL